MPQTFDVMAAPLSDAIIQQTRTRYGRLALFYYWLWFPWLVFSLFVGFEVFRFVLPVTAPLELSTALIGIVAGLLTALALSTTAASCGRYFKKVHQIFSPLAKSMCLDALTLARRHPELEAYRLAVVAERLFTIGDLEAMQRYVTEKAWLAMKAEVEAKHQASCDALHRAA